MTCRVVNSACQGPAETRPYGFDLTTFATRFRKPGAIYTTGVSVRPSPATGFEYEVTSGGQTSAKPFKFSTTLAETKVDGGVTYTTRAISNASLERTISSCEWVVPDGSGLVISDETVNNSGGVQTVGCSISGGTLGETYRVIARVTFTDGTDETIEDFGIDLEIE